MAKQKRRVGHNLAPAAAKQAAPAPATQSSQPSAQAAAALAEKAAVDALLNQLEAARSRPAIVYWITQAAKVSTAVELTLADQLMALPSNAELDLVLYTFGGDTEAPARIVDLIREYTTHLTVLVPHLALSSGTLIALGADEIQMTPLGTLGPIDPSRAHPLLPRKTDADDPEPVSVQDMQHAMQFIKDAVGPDVKPSSEAWAQIITSLFDKVHPLAIGAIEQSYALAKLIARHNIETHMDKISAEKQITAIIDKLCDGYKSHGYRISRKEAGEIGLNVVNPTPTVETILFQLVKHYLARPIAPGLTGQPKKGSKVITHIAWMDSVRQKYRCEQTSLVKDAAGTLQSISDGWKAY